MADRVTQVVRQTIALPTDANGRATQVMRQTIALPTDAEGRVTQVMRQVIVQNIAAPTGIRRRYAAVIG